MTAIKHRRVPPFDWSYDVEDFHGDRSTTRTFEVVWFYRRLSVSWSGPLRRAAQNGRSTDA